MHPRLPTTFRALVALAAWLCLCAAPAARAQDDADVEIGVSKVEQVQITKVDDILIGVFPANATIDGRQFRPDQFDYQCVYSSTGGYRLQIASANGAGRLRLLSQNDDPMTYELHLWYRRINGAFQFVSTRYPTAPIDLPGLSASTSPTCADEGLGNSNLIVTGLVLQNDFNNAPPGVYQDVLTLTVSPE